MLVGLIALPWRAVVCEHTWEIPIQKYTKTKSPELTFTGPQKEWYFGGDEIKKSAHSRILPLVTCFGHEPLKTISCTEVQPGKCPGAEEQTWQYWLVVWTFNAVGILCVTPLTSLITTPQSSTRRWWTSKPALQGLARYTVNFRVMEGHQQRGRIQPV